MVEKQEFRLRPAVEVDQEAIKTLIRAVQINPMGLDWRRFVVAVAADDGRLLGCGQVKPHRDGSRELASIAVEREWRKTGIARSIIEELQRAHGSPLWLTCLSKLVPFYTKFGFTEVMESAAMPPYFRRIRFVMNLAKPFTQMPGYLAVMHWQVAVNSG